MISEKCSIRSFVWTGNLLDVSTLSLNIVVAVRTL
eukprot:COSAG04_NODE_981_length_9013_cov_4.862928_8_plen_35_part_00